jgi:hypothetical protein
MCLARALTVTLLAFAPLAADAQVKAYSVPVSNDRIVLIMQVGGHSPATVHVRNGEMARVKPGDAPTIGLTPLLKDGHLQLVALEVLVDESTGNEGLRQLAKYDMQQGSVTRIDVSEPAFDVTWETTLPPAVTPPATSGPCLNCCVPCGDTLYCGCVVITDCGRCCCPAACPCPFEPAATAPPGQGCGLTTGQAEDGQRPVHSTVTGTGVTSKRMGTPGRRVPRASSVWTGVPSAVAPPIWTN